MIVQTPSPGTVQVFHCGDTIRFELSLEASGGEGPDDMSLDTGPAAAIDPEALSGTGAATASETLRETGTAWLRTDLGNAAVFRREIIHRVEKEDIHHNDAWRDIPMVRQAVNRFTLTLPLLETGHFRAKCYFLPPHGTEPVWPEGDNILINVEPAAFSSGLIIYNAFVRQFGDTRHLEKTPPPPCEEAVQALEAAGYAVIPPSGKFRDLTAQVEFIVNTLGCRFLQLLPIHPTPTTYARMGRFGSPYAALDFFNVDPALAVFDPSATPMEQFLELVNEVHRFNACVILDIAVNHTGWAASIHERHPHWLKRDNGGRIEMPGAWGVTWEDLTRLDYEKTDLWIYMADMFLEWCGRGVDGFRCDAGYMIPARAWRYIISRVREEYPDTIFFLEGLGGEIAVTCDLLNRTNMNWAYSELFQNYTGGEIRTCMDVAMDISEKYGTLIHFAETHDNNRLAGVSQRYAAMRTALCALLSLRGGFGFANGVEWFATEKINVHQSGALNWGADVNQVEQIRTLSAVLTSHPVFGPDATIRFLENRDPRTLVLGRWNPKQDRRLLVLINLDCETARPASWPRGDFEFSSRGATDLLGDTPGKVRLEPDHDRIGVLLAPGQAMALSPDDEDAGRIARRKERTGEIPESILQRRLRKKAFEIHCARHGFSDVSDVDADDLGTLLYNDPAAFLKKILSADAQTPLVPWVWERDATRTVMVPPGFCLYVTAPAPFRAEIRWTSGGRATSGRRRKPCRRGEQAPAWEAALPLKNGGYFALFPPRKTPDHAMAATLKITIAAGEGRTVCDAELLYLSSPGRVAGTACSPHGGPVAVDGPTGSGGSLGNRLCFKTNTGNDAHNTSLPPARTDPCCDPALAGHPVFTAQYTRERIMADPGLKLLGTTRRGAMMRAPAWWGRLESRYDALLAANLSPRVPENRWIMLSRFRIWAVVQGYSRELTLDCLESFHFSYDNAGIWRFRVPTLQGGHFGLEFRLLLHSRENALRFMVRHTAVPAPCRQAAPPTTSPSAAIPVQASASASASNATPDQDQGRAVTLIIRPDVEDRSFHDTVKAWTGPEQAWPAALTETGGGFVFGDVPGRRLIVESDRAGYSGDPEWQYMVHRPLEAARGLDADSDLFSPGYFKSSLQENETLVIQARVGDPSEPPVDFGDVDALFASPAVFPEAFSLVEGAVKSMSAFVVDRSEHKSIVAGYPWFLDWGRDSLIVCRGLIEAGKYDDAADVLKLFGQFEQNGTLPNMIHGRDAANRETSDAPLWLFAAVRDLTTHRGEDILDTLAGGRTLRNILSSIARWLIRGTDTGIVMDPETGLLYSPSHFTWMDTNHPAGTPRMGYPVEIQALWYNALMFMQTVDPAGEQTWRHLADKVKNAVDALFFLPEEGYYMDCLHCDGPVGAARAEPDDALRPNQLLVITLGLAGKGEKARRAVEACMELLVPGGIRSLADRPVRRPLVVSHDGRDLNDSLNPYWGHYAGDEDTRRKPAYHNGTAWTWPFPVFCEAWARVFGQPGARTALAWLGSSAALMETGSAGFIPEILDGDHPHVPRGCDAQAWGSSELARVWLNLSTQLNNSNKNKKSSHFVV